MQGHEEMIISLGGNPEDITDNAANVVAWGNSYSTWVNKYGEEDALKALRQGNIDYEKYETGWSQGAIYNAQEFLDIKKQLDEMIF